MGKNTDKINLVAQLLDMTKKKVTLLEELIESLKYEECEYHLNRVSQIHTTTFVMARISDGETIVSGRISNIKSYIRTRKISPELIYNVGMLGDISTIDKDGNS